MRRLAVASHLQSSARKVAAVTESKFGHATCYTYASKGLRRLCVLSKRAGLLTQCLSVTALLPNWRVTAMRVVYLCAAFALLLTSWDASGSPGAAPPTSPARAPRPTHLLRYALIDVGTLSGQDMQATGINGKDVLVGLAGAASSSHAFVYQRASGALNDLGPGAAYGINDAGEIVGMQNQGNGSVALLWKTGGGSMQLPSIATSDPTNDAAYAIDRAGHIVGTSAHVSAEWASPTAPPTALTYETTATAALAISGKGTYIAGFITAGTACSGNSADLLPLAYLYSNGQFTQIGTIPSNMAEASQSTATGADEKGEVVGSSSVVLGVTDGTCSETSHAFLYRDGAWTDLKTLGDFALQSQANGINDSSEIVGWSQVNDGTTHAFLLRANENMLDLNSLVELSAFVTLREAVAINCNGDIAANGTDSRDARRHAYLLIRKGPRRSHCDAR